MAVNRKYRDARSLAREAAVFMAARLSRVGIRTVVVSREEARRVRREGAPGTEFSVADIQRLNYQWNGEQVSLKAFAQAFMPLIKNKDRTLEDVERIAEAFIADVKSSPEKYVPQLKAENMSHARYFILRDGSVWTPEHPMAHSPEYETQQALWKIYSHVLGTERMEDFISLLDPARLRTDAENERFVSMEREVSRSDLMQQTLESNADKVNADRVRAVRNLVQYFDGNPDYTASEKALILKGAMTWGVSEKKGGDATEVRLVKLTDANDLAVPVVGGEAAAIVEGLRKGMTFKDALKEAREQAMENGVRSVPRNYTGWKVYPKSNREEDAVVLNRDASGTGWCTGSGLSTARSHLSGGDFHIYFEAGEPLIAIRTVDGRMAEPPRGAHEGQFCTDREEQIAFEYINQGNGITAGDDYVADILDIRKIMSPEATWKDAFMFPCERRYNNGEFGGDTKAWGKAVEDRISRLISSVSPDERHKSGCYYVEEVAVKEIRASYLSRYIIDKDLPADCAHLKGNVSVYFEGNYLILNNLKSISAKVVFINDGLYLQADALQSVGGDLYVSKDATLQADALQSVGGSLEVSEGSTLQAVALQSVEEDFTVHEGVTLQANALQSVGRDLFVSKDATLQADALQSVGGDLYVNENTTLQADSLESVIGDITVYKNATVRADSLKSIGGYLKVYEYATWQADSLGSIVGRLIVYENATLRADSLESIGGDVAVNKNATLQANSLGSVDGDMLVYENATLQAQSLKNIGKDLDVYENVILWTESLKSIGGKIIVHEKATLRADSLENIGGDLYVYEKATLRADSLENIGGDLYVYENATLQVNSLEGVANGIHVYKNAFLEALNLKSVNKKADIHFHDTAILRIPNLKEDFSFSNGVIYGYQIGDTIFLTPDGINPETPIHEYAHVWAKAMQRLRPGQWETVKEALKELPVWDRVSADPEYRNLVHDEDRLAGEVLAAVTGGFGAKLLEETAGEFVSGRRGESWSVGDVVEAFRETVSSFAVKEVFGCGERLSARGATLLVLKDLSEGRNPAQSLKGGLREDNPEKGPSVQNELINHAGRRRPQYKIKL